MTVSSPDVEKSCKMATSDGSDAPAPSEPPKPALKLISSFKSFDGWQRVYEHCSEVLKCAMKFAIYLPPGTEEAELLTEKFPVLYWLSGLTCTEQNFVTKAGAQQYASKRDIILVAPDTSPRSCGIEGEDDANDFGTGAGFYVDATEEKWKANYNMYSYVTKELPALINANFPARPDKQSIFGHSMGGHGALICALKNPGKYCSVSAFAPICNPINCAWGQKAFNGYLGPDREAWKQYDATELVKKYKGPPFSYVLIDQGKADQFLSDGQLLPENFMEGCRQGNIPVLLRSHEGYDHNYYFIASFMEDHIKHHVAALVGEEEEEDEEEGEGQEGAAEEKAATATKEEGAGEPEAKEKEGGTGELPAKDKQGGTGEPPAKEEEKEEGAGEPAAKEKEGGTGELPAKEKQGGTGEPPAKEEEKEGGTGEPPAKEKQGGTGEPPAKEEEKEGGAGEPAAKEKEGGTGEPAAKEEEKEGGTGEPPAKEEEKEGGAGKDSKS